MNDTPKPDPRFHKMGERSINDIIKDLAKPLDDRYVKTKDVGKGNVRPYIPWYQATRLLDQYAPGWGFEIVQLAHIGNKVAMVVQLNIPCKEGIVSRQATGNESDDTDSWGDPFSNAESMALRRAAAKFGLGRYFYNQSDSSPNTPIVSDPIAKSLSDLVTQKQLGMIKALAHKAGLDPDKECQSRMDCLTDELSKNAASKFITYLQTHQDGAMRTG